MNDFSQPATTIAQQSLLGAFYPSQGQSLGRHWLCFNLPKSICRGKLRNRRDTKKFSKLTVLTCLAVLQKQWKILIQYRIAARRTVFK